ncbi:hypothetical protein L9F63_022261 [Diploptera punctata]|uniref:E3 ubiquitin-protein ligase RNF170 n=1 Tax=Diploptera punctata TaxID=6984 RepID=A0AAD7ZMZ4_DIPPU|nr:hypothetical protein L9F63_022261 [Diploptera punctata]
MDTLVFGVGDEVLLSITCFSIIVVPVLIVILSRINWRQLQMHIPFSTFFHRRAHPDSGNRVENVEPGITYNPERCPICLNTHRLAVETNCGHLYCGNCLQTYILTEGIRAPITCPMCRQPVNMLFSYFTSAERQASPSSEIGIQLNTLNEMISRYNRRFSGAPRTIMEMIWDVPILLRHLCIDFFTAQGLVWMFRIRILLCFLAGILYLFSPLDLIPETVFGIIGLMDDVFVVFVLTVYVTIIYRRVVSSRGQRNE